MRITEVRIKLHVRDFATRQRFYADTLGLPVVLQWDGGVMFRLGASILELLRSDVGSGRHDGQADLSLQVEDVWELWQRYREVLPIRAPLGDNPWGDTSFSISDPGGFGLTFFTQTVSRPGPA